MAYPRLFMDHLLRLISTKISSCHCSTMRRIACGVQYRALGAVFTSRRCSINNAGYADVHPAPARYAANLLAALIVVVAAAGCAHSPTDRSIDDKANLEMTVKTFHRDMRWRRWESAAMVVTPERRQRFLGRYEELGDDFHIANLEIKSLSRLDQKAIVDLEQEYYKEPAMIVKKDRFIEVWTQDGGDWLMSERMLKDEFKQTHRGQLEDARNEAAERKKKRTSP